MSTIEITEAAHGETHWNEKTSTATSVVGLERLHSISHRQ